MKSLIAAITFCIAIVSTNVVSAHDQEPTHYTPSELVIIRARAVGENLVVEFRPRPDTWYWCPGVKWEDVKEGLAVTFVRCPVKEDVSVDAKAERGKNFKQTVKIPMKGKDIFIKDDKKLSSLYKQAKPTVPVSKKKR